MISTAEWRFKEKNQLPQLPVRYINRNYPYLNNRKNNGEMIVSSIPLGCIQPKGPSGTITEQPTIISSVLEGMKK